MSIDKTLENLSLQLETANKIIEEHKKIFAEIMGDEEIELGDELTHKIVEMLKQESA